MAEFNSTLSLLQAAISLIPLIDSHAHNVFQSYNPSENYPREMIVPKATGPALNDAKYSLANLRMRSQLAQFLELPTDASWSTVQTTVQNRDYETLCRDLIKAAGIQIILFDDGIVNEHCHPISWHNRLTPYPNKRIVGIETLFESIVAKAGHRAAFDDFIHAVKKYTDDQDVIGFKSIAAYRTGLDTQLSNLEATGSTRLQAAKQEVELQTDSTPSTRVEHPVIMRQLLNAALSVVTGRGRPRASSATSSFPHQVLEQEVQRQTGGTSPFRVENPVIVRWLLNTTLSIITGRGKPIQLYTGPENDVINLMKADVSFLQPLIKAYPDVSFVLLHSGYSHARQAGYLATMYPNVYLEFSLAIPLLSGSGQRDLVHQLMGICPTNKLLWSSDAAFYPERFYLGALQSRQALVDVLAEYIERQEIRFEEALVIAKQVFFENSNKLYGLRINYAELNPPAHFDASRRVYPTPTAVISVPSPAESAQLARIPPNLDLPASIAFMKSQGIKFIRLAWLDYVNIMRYRIIPIDRFASLSGSKFIYSPESSTTQRIAESGLSLTRVALTMGVRGLVPSGLPTSGDTDLKADFSSMWKAPFAPNHAYMMGRFFEKPYYQTDGGVSDICPRTILHNLIRRAECELDAKFLVGFETEFNLLDRDNNPVRNGPWTSSKQLEYGSAADCVHEIAQCIMDSGIKLEIYHAESAGGQYEVVTGPLPPLQAADALVATREIIYNIAQKHGYRATLSPRFFPNQTGTACHAHISVQSPRSDIPSNHPDIPSLPSDLASLMAGLLENLVSVCAFTLPIDASYSRVTDGFWSGGSWVCWGRENKEAPLRLCGSGKNLRVELKSFDGIANPYLGLAAVIGAGVAGLSGTKILEMRNCPVAAASLTEQQRQDMQITTRLPRQSPVLEPELGLDTDFIRSWLPDSAWTLFKSARENERKNLVVLKQDEGNANLNWRELSAIACRGYY
ncbi:hypothetical protein OPQ81_000965 [Rhizoctonia solani]|nr:hypothetical protein OPQ81_000965 [Rhizoctonia solani]